MTGHGTAGFVTLSTAPLTNFRYHTNWISLTLSGTKPLVK